MTTLSSFVNVNFYNEKILTVMYVTSYKIELVDNDVIDLRKPENLRNLRLMFLK